MKIAILQNKWHQNIEENLRNVVRKAKEMLKDKDIDFFLFRKIVVVLQNKILKLIHNKDYSVVKTLKAG